MFKGFKVLVSVLLLPYIDLFFLKDFSDGTQITIWLERFNLQNISADKAKQVFEALIGQ